MLKHIENSSMAEQMRAWADAMVFIGRLRSCYETIP